MKRIMMSFLFTIACCLFFNSFAQNNELTIPLTNPGQVGHLNVDVHSGTVTIVAANRKDVLLRYESLNEEEEEVPTASEAPNGMTRISTSGLKLDVLEKNNQIHINSGHGNRAIAVWVEVPQNFNLTVGTHHHGEVKIDGVHGEIVIDAHHGGIAAHDIAGSIVANTWHGDILVEMTGMDQEASNALSTYHGIVDVSLPNSAKADLKLRSAKGEVFTDFDVQLVQADALSKKRTEDGTYQVSLMDWVTGQINGGGPELMAKTHHADIYIRKQ